MKKKLLFWIVVTAISIGGKAYSQPVDTALCEYYQAAMNSVIYPQEGYDRGREFVEHCAGWAPVIYEFSDLGEYNAERSTDQGRFTEFREWLKKVLYYGASNRYYCADAWAIARSFSNYVGYSRNDKAIITVLKYIVSSGKCREDSLYIDSLAIPAEWKHTYSLWLDTVVNYLESPFDSTLPSLDDLDLGILRGQSSVSEQAQLAPNFLSLIASGNPFLVDAKITILLKEDAPVSLEVFDIIGNSYYSEKRYLQQGSSSWPISGMGLPKGILYVRISSLNEVKTVKLIHK